VTGPFTTHSLASGPDSHTLQILSQALHACVALAASSSLRALAVYDVPPVFSETLAS
jgi:hypothetical protein